MAFVAFRLVLIGEEVVDVVETVHEAMLLVAVDFELLALASCLVGDGLVGEVDLDDGLMVLVD